MAAVLLAMFGILTLFLSSSIIFDWFGIREREGNYVPFIVQANFVCSVIYLISAYSWVKVKPWTHKLLALALVILLVAFTGLLVHIRAGGLHETKTIGAMIFRMSVTALFAGWAYFTIGKGPSSQESVPESGDKLKTR